MISVSDQGVRDYVFVGSLIIAFTFYSVRQYDTNTLLSIIVIAIVAYVAVGFIDQRSKDQTGKREDTLKMFDKEMARLEGVTAAAYQDNVTVGPFPRGNERTGKTGKAGRYIRENQVLVEIATALHRAGLHRRDRVRYADLLLLMNRYQRMYMHILMDREDAAFGLTTFTDIGELILEHLYGLVFVYPLNNALVQANITKFTELRRTMTRVLESYAKKELRLPIVPITLPRASDPCKAYKSHVLP